MFVIHARNIRFFYKEAKVKPRETLYINAKHAIVSDEGFVRLFDERGEQIFAGCLEFEKFSNDEGTYDKSDMLYRYHSTLKDGVRIGLLDECIAYFTDISAEEV